MPNKVVSKYFSNEAGMDDSSSDFKEKKKYNTGPKNVKKGSNNKKPKRTRGQKDIRTLIKNQENDVLLYSKDFNKVCKDSGVDVDSEELQLAIALSKSLQETKNDYNSNIEVKSSEPLTPHQRALKIKTTLQEYGFKVKNKTRPVETNKRKRLRKQSKLLLISEAERQQIISDKYSEVLAGNIFKSPIKVIENDYSDKELYYKTTNIAYELIKNDNVYYLNNLFVKSGHKNCLLRDWSKIPGRPLSPTIEVNDINFDDILCDQRELDCILSGTISAAQQLVSKKNIEIVHSKSKDCNVDIDKAAILKLEDCKSLEYELRHIDDTVSKTKNTNLEESNDNFKLKPNTMSYSQVRCISPDIFEDEESTVIECSDNELPNSGQQISNSDNINTYCMDLTECVNIESNNSGFGPNTNLVRSNKYNVTSRKSNDLMEITECVSSISNQIDVENVDLTQSSSDSNKQIDNIISQNDDKVMDLTQVSDYDPLIENINEMNAKKDNSLDNTIILIDEEVNLKLPHQKSTFGKLSEPICVDDLNNSENDSSCENNKQGQSLCNNFKGQSFKIDWNDDERYLPNNMKEFGECTNETVEKQPDELDLTQSSESLQEDKDKSIDVDCGDSERVSLRNMKESTEHSNEIVDCQPGGLDLTQSSRSSSQGDIFIDQLISKYASSLGKKDNVSIDYDEINDIYSESVNSFKLDGCLEYESNSIKSEANITNKDITDSEKNSKLGFPKNESFENNDLRCDTIINKNGSSDKNASNSNNDIASNPNKSSELFEISDNEFNYFLHQSKHENFNFRDLSVMNDLMVYENVSIKDNHSAIRNRSLSESNLQKESINIVSPLKVSQSQKLTCNSEDPIRIPRENLKNVLNTPKNSEFIIKTNEVTPMLDYASMSSPERNKELEKYGIKPFKRKRAVQLLTYLYNQTHPVIESHEEVGPSPSKRQKIDDSDEKRNAPQKITTSQPLVHLDSIRTTYNASVKCTETVQEVNKENDLYAITNEQPDIRKIECDAEDWFFQKREKAKLHSCRVPLHVAFHNYVSCRRRLKEAILRYEPVNIDVIHKDLVAAGFRYNPKDLLKFMDRKCITVKTADNNSRNRK